MAQRTTALGVSLDSAGGERSARGAGDPGVPPGSRLGAWVLDEPLAEGGFGVVLRARHAERGEPAAMKILHAELAAHPDVIARFEREVETIQRVRHPSVVEVLEQGRLPDGRPWFAMELLHGESLEEHLRARGRLSLGEAIAILTPLCDALSVAHRQGIVHRDVKPSNVFLCRDGRVVLLDFGVAKLLDAPGPALTASRAIVGTMMCAAPEQLLGRPVDARTDVYALGALLYALLTGEPPFTEASLPVLRQLHLHAAPARPSARARVPAAVDEVVLRALRKDPAERQPGAAALLEELRAAAAEARADGGGEQRAAGVYVEVRADAEVLEDPDEALLSDLESVLPAAAEALAAAGLAPALESGSSLLAVTALEAGGGDDDGDGAMRRAAIEAAKALHLRLSERPGRDARVRVRICVHAGAIRRGEDGALAGGDLLELGAWAPDVDAPGLFATAAALQGLGVEAARDVDTPGDPLRRLVV